MKNGGIRPWSDGYHVKSKSARISLLSRLSSAFCKPVDNSFSLDRYIDGSLIMVGDRARLSRRLLPDIDYTVTALNKHRHIDNFETYSATVERRNTLRNACLSRLSLIERRKHYREHWLRIFDGDASRWTTDRLKELALISADFREACVYLAFDQPVMAERILVSIVNRVDSLQEASSKDRLTPSRLLEYPTLLQDRVYAAALLGENFDRSVLIASAEMLQKQCDETGPNYWGAWEQDKYLSAVRAAIISGELDYARTLLKSKRSFSRHKDQRGLLKKLVRRSISPSDDPELAELCHYYLDFVRRPHASNHSLFSGGLEWLEWAVIVNKYFRANGNGEIDWRGVVKEVLR